MIAAQCLMIHGSGFTAKKGVIWLKAHGMFNFEALVNEPEKQIDICFFFLVSLGSSILFGNSWLSISLDWLIDTFELLLLIIFC